MVSKKILGVAIAAAFSSQAFANIDFNADSPAKSKIAKQALVDTGKETIGGSTYYLVGQGVKLDTSFDVKAGIGISVAQKRWVRVSLNNAYFGTTLTGTEFDAAIAANLTAAVVQGGQAKDSYVVYEVTGATAGVAQTDVLTFTAGNLLVPSTGTAGISYAIYSTIDGAVGATPAGTPLASKGVTDAITIVDGLVSAFTPGTVTADVESAFKKVLDVANGTYSNIGKFALTAEDAAENDGTALALGDMLDLGAGKSKVKYTGDFTVGTFALSSASNCAGPVAVSLDTAKTSFTVDGSVAVANPFLCFTVADNTKIIPQGDYKAALTVDKASDIAFAAGNVSGTVGSIGRNGTTVQVPYLTTFGEYNQRLVLVNRGNADYPYTVSFTTEAGVTAVAGTAATGTLMKGQTKVIKSTDLVALTGGSRTAATVVISAPSANIDAATTTVDLTDGVTDTVVLD